METEVILVDEKDNPTGVMEKLRAHREGALHRAFSVFVFNDRGDLLMHKRADEKYHSGGLWTNTCCSHPIPGEQTSSAALRRLQEEMGMQCELHKCMDFIYKAEVGNDLFEHEFDHVFVGTSNENPTPDPAEASDWKWMSTGEIDAALLEFPQKYTAWFKIAWPMINARLHSKRRF